MNETLEVVVGHSIGLFSLGMIRKQIWDQYRYPITCFYKTPLASLRSDDISLLGVHIHYDKEEKSNLIEAWTSVEFNQPQVMLEGVVLNGLNMHDIEALCSVLPYAFLKTDAGFESKEGLGLYCHNFSSGESLLDGIYVEKKKL